MDQSDEAKAAAQILQRTLETVCRKIQAEKGFSAEQVGVALGATSIVFLSEAWSPREVIAHLAGLASSLCEVHGIDPETGQDVPRGRPN